MKTVIEMAQEVGFQVGQGALLRIYLEHFAELVAAAERETCAKVAFDADHMGNVNLKLLKNRIGNAIRARGVASLKGNT